MRARLLFLVFLAATTPALARPAPDSFADLTDKLLPTVVSIATSQTMKQGAPQASLPDIVSPTVASILMSRFGVSTLFGLNAVLHLVLAVFTVVIMRVRPPAAPGAARLA